MGFTLSLKVGVSLSEVKDFAACLHTHNTGVGTIHLTAKCPLDICSPDEATFSDQVQIIKNNDKSVHFLRYFLLKEYSKHKCQILTHLK